MPPPCLSCYSTAVQHIENSITVTTIIQKSFSSAADVLWYNRPHKKYAGATCGLPCLYYWKMIICNFDIYVFVTEQYSALAPYDGYNSRRLYHRRPPLVERQIGKCIHGPQDKDEQQPGRTRAQSRAYWSNVLSISVAENNIAERMAEQHPPSQLATKPPTYPASELSEITSQKEANSPELHPHLAYGGGTEMQWTVWCGNWAVQ